MVGEKKTIIRSPKGEGRREVDLASVQIPDLWHVAMRLGEEGKPASRTAVLECWHLCHDLLANLRGDV